MARSLAIPKQKLQDEERKQVLGEGSLALY